MAAAGTHGADSPDTHYPGRKFSLPATGAGSVAGMGIRVGAFLIDVALSGLVGYLFTYPAAPQNWSLVIWAVITVVGVGLFGSSPGQLLLGIRVAPVGGDRMIGLWAIPRTAMVFVIVPAVITDADTRGLHDRLCRTIVVRTR